MLTKMTMKNFKRFGDVEVELGNPVVFIGPNNSGKTTALQALSLWDVGLKRWLEKRGTKTPRQRPGVTINRRDLISIPVPNANLLWRGLHVRDVSREGGKTKKTENIRIEIIVEGVSESRPWICGFEFDYANTESLYCRPLRRANGAESDRMEVPPELAELRVAFLPPMSGLADREFAKQGGEISFLIGQGRTAEVLRNLCWQLSSNPEKNEEWTRIVDRIERFFGVRLENPVFLKERSEIVMSYRDQRENVSLDLTASGRGLQQTLLLLSYVALNPDTVLLVDEPDAHLEILRQREIYQLLSEVARGGRSQIVIASHSEIVLNEAADRDVVVAFVGKPHRIDDRGNQVLKALKEIGFDQYYQAEQTGWVLYLEGATDLAILRAFADSLDHPVKKHLERPFVHYILNLPNRAREHFHGLRVAKPELLGFVLVDRIERDLHHRADLRERMWQRREIENYLCQPETLLRYAEDSARETSIGPLFDEAEVEKRRPIMEECIEDFVPPVALRNPDDRWWFDTKASDNFLDRLFDTFYKKLGLPNLMRKTDYHALAYLVPARLLDPEIARILDEILAVATEAERVNADPS